jgi:hypothetical protein
MLQNFLIPQVDDNMGPDELPNFLQDVCNLLENHYPGRWIGHGGGHMAWTPRSLDFTPLDFTLWDFVKDIVYMPLMPKQHWRVEDPDFTSHTVSGRGDARQDHGRTLISLGHMPCYKGSTY